MSRFLLIQARNFGDAVISTGMIEALGNSFVDAEIAVLTRPQFRTIFANNPLVTSVYCASFPMGTVKNFRTREAVHLAARVAKLRHRRFTVVSLAGDFRENALGWLINPQGNYGVIWADEHPYRKLVRQGMT